VDKPHAIRLADALDQLYKTPPSVTEAAIELRRLQQSEQEGWRWARECEAEVKRLKEIIDELENDDPPKREWIGMSDIEIEIYGNQFNGNRLIREIIGILRERNT